MCDTLQPKLYSHNKFGISTANNIGDVQEVKFKVTQPVRDTLAPQHVSTIFCDSYLKTIQDICSRYDLPRTRVRGQGQNHSNPRNSM